MNSVLMKRGNYQVGRKIYDKSYATYIACG